MTFWSAREVQVLFRAVSQAPSVHNTQPWVMELHERSVLLFERLDVSLPSHDPTGRDRLMSCGAALANLELAIHELGWQTSTSLFPDPGHPDLVATVTALRRQPSTDTEHLLYQAIAERHSYRLRFDSQPVSHPDARAVEKALAGERVGSHRIEGTGEASAVADIAEHAAEVLRWNRRYQWELRSWTARRRAARAGLPPAGTGHGLFGGLVHFGDSVPDHEALTARIGEEFVLVVQTVDDGPRDHVLAGAAIERAWLVATDLGLAMSVITQPFGLPEARAGLSEKLHLPGFPHALVRIGRSDRQSPASPRRSFAELMRP